MSSQIHVPSQKGLTECEAGGCDGRSGLTEKDRYVLLPPGFEPSFLLPYILDVRTSLSLTWPSSLVDRERWNRLLKEGVDWPLVALFETVFVSLFVCLVGCPASSVSLRCAMSCLVFTALLVKKWRLTLPCGLWQRSFVLTGQYRLETGHCTAQWSLYVPPV